MAKPDHTLQNHNHGQRERERLDRTKQISREHNKSDLEDGECKAGYIIYILYQSMMRYGLEQSYLLNFFLFQWK